jgi:hypothetical protein
MMIRSTNPRVIVAKEGWRDVILEEDFYIPPEVVDPQAYTDREKITRYLDNHPARIFRYFVNGQEQMIDCKVWPMQMRKKLAKRGASEADIIEAIFISKQFYELVPLKIELNRLAFTNGKTGFKNGILDARTEDLLDLFGRLHSIEEVHQIALKEWGFQVNLSTIRHFYNRNLKEIDRLREKYAADYSDVSLSKKRARLDKRATMFYTYYQKWQTDPRIDYANLMLKILDQIEKEVEGEQININVNGQINVDMTMEVNKTLFNVYKRVPVNNLIIAMVAAKRGIDPTNLMTQLTSSYYRSLTGYGKYEPAKELVHPVDLTYNWNEIAQKHRNKDKSIMIEDAVIVDSLGSPEKDMSINVVKSKLMALLEKDKLLNEKRKSK